MIYADHAATTQLAPEALNAMMPYLTNQYGNASQPYAFSRMVRKALQAAREMIADCIHALPEEIYFTSGGTESDNWALKGTMFEYGDHRALITSQIEHHAILHSAAAIERMGYPVVYLPSDKSGTIQPYVLEDYIGRSTKLVSLMFSNNEVGTVQPIEELATIAHNHGSLFHTDAVQAVGHVKIDVEQLGVDMLSASAHKFNGPKGIGFLYVKNRSSLHPFIDGGAQESGRRSGTENVAAIVGMAEALKINCDRIEENTRRLHEMENDLLSRLSNAGLDYIRNGSNQIPGNISLSFKDSDGEMILHRLDLMGICVSTGSACDSKEKQISHVLKAMKVSESYAHGTIRVSLGPDNSIDDTCRIANALIKILKPHL